MTTQEKIEVMQAHARGETIQNRIPSYGIATWADDSDPTWNWEKEEFRVKPKPLTFWVNIASCEVPKVPGFTGWTFASKQEADRDKISHPAMTTRTVKMVEVIE